MYTAKWLIERVAPQLLAEHGAYLHIYGKASTAEKCLEAMGCIYHGYVNASALASGIQGARWMVAPVFTDVGVSTKILKALALGTPVVTTKAGLGGMDDVTGVLPIVVEKDNNYTQTVLRTYNDEVLWTSLSPATKPFIRKNFGLERLVTYTEGLVKLTTSRRVGTVVEGLAQPRRRLNVYWRIASEGRPALEALHNIFPFLTEFNNFASHEECAQLHSSIDVYIRLTHRDEFPRPTCCPRESCKHIVYLLWEMKVMRETTLEQIRSQVDFVWALSTYHATFFQQSGVEASIIRAVPFGVNCSTLAREHHSSGLRQALNIAQSTVVFTYIGEGLFLHGIEVTMKAYELAFSSDEDVLLLLVVPHKSEVLESWVRNVSSQQFNRPIKTVYVGVHDVHEVYAASDVYIHPIGAEFSLAPLEALAAGKIVITVRRGVMVDYLTRNTLTHLLRVKIRRKKAKPDAATSMLQVDRYTLRSDLNETLFTVLHHRTQTTTLASFGRKLICDSYQWDRIALNTRAEIHITQQFEATLNNKWRDHPGLPKLLQKSNDTMKREQSILAITDRKKTIILWDIPLSENSSMSSILDLLPFIPQFTHIVTHEGGCPINVDDVDIYITVSQIPYSTRPFCCLPGFCRYVLYLIWYGGMMEPTWVPQVEGITDELWLVSSFHQSLLIESRMQPSKLKVLPFGVDCNALLSMKENIRQQLRISDSTIVFSYITSEAEAYRAGMDLVVQAYGKQFVENENVLLLIVMPPRMRVLRKRMEDTCAKLCKRPMRILTSGKYNNADFLHVTDVLLHPIGKDWSSAVLGALALGKIVIAPSEGAMQDYLVKTSFSFLTKVNFLSSRTGSEDTLLPITKYNIDVKVLGKFMNKTYNILSGFGSNRSAYALKQKNEGRHMVCDSFHWERLFGNVYSQMSSLLEGTFNSLFF